LSTIPINILITVYFKDERIITYERFSKADWEYLKKVDANRYRHDQCEQLMQF